MTSPLSHLRWSPRTAINFGLLIVVLTLCAIALHRNALELWHSYEHVTQAHTVISHCEQLLEHLSSAESSVRGYLATGDEEFLQEYHSALKSIPTIRLRLNKLIEQNPTQLENFQRIVDALEHKLPHLALMLNLRKEKGAEAGLDELKRKLGKKYMDAIRAATATLRNQEEALLQTRSSVTEQKLSTILVVNWSGLVLTLAMCGIAWWMINNEVLRCRKAEDKAEWERSNLLTTLNSIGDGVIVTDAQGTITLLNPVAESLMGRGAEVVGHSLFDNFPIFHESTRQIVENPVAKALLRGTVVGMDNHTVLVRPDGSEVPIEDSAAPIRDSQGRIAGVVLVFRDCTDRMIFEKKLKARESRFRRMFETPLIGIAVVTGDGSQIRFANDAYLQMLQLNREDLDTSAHDSPPVTPHWNPLTETVLQELHTTGLGQPYETECEHSDGTAVPLLISTAKLLDESDNIVLFAVELTTIKEVESQLKLEHQRKDQFLAMLAHELRNPLAPIANAVQVLEATNYDAAQVSELVPLMHRQVNQLKRLIDDLLDVARITQGRIQLKQERVSVTAIANDAMAGAKPVLQEREHQFQSSLPAEDLYIHADAARIIQVLTNLLVNAAKYTDPRGRIALHVERDDCHVLFRIRDTGVGLAPDMLKRVFDMFVQVEHSLSRSQGGLGLGLSLAKQLVERHGGTIHAFSEGLGLGSEFIVRLSLDQTASDRGDESLHPQNELTPLPTLHVLVVDDVRASARTMALMLSTLGQKAEAAFDGPTALEKLKAGRFDVAFLDLAMPGMDGFEVVRQIRQDPQLSGLFLVALTGFGQDQDRQRSLETGFDEHLTKPTSLQLLREVLSRVRHNVK